MALADSALQMYSGCIDMHLCTLLHVYECPNMHLCMLPYATICPCKPMQADVQGLCIHICQGSLLPLLCKSL